MDLRARRAWAPLYAEGENFAAQRAKNRSYAGKVQLDLIDMPRLLPRDPTGTYPVQRWGRCPGTLVSVLHGNEAIPYLTAWSTLRYASGITGTIIQVLGWLQSLSACYSNRALPLARPALSEVVGLELPSVPVPPHCI